MPDYINKVLDRYQHPRPHVPTQTTFRVASHQSFKPGHRQYAPAPDMSAPLTPTDTTRIQGIVGSLFYYARAINTTLLPALNTIASTQASPTELTKQHCDQLLNYCATYPNVFVRYHASAMMYQPLSRYVVVWNALLVFSLLVHNCQV